MLRITALLISGLLLGCAAEPQTPELRSSSPASDPTAPPSTTRSPSPSSKPIKALGRIAFASDRDGDFEIFVMNEDGTGQQQLTHNDVDDHSPSWAPDGRSLVFVKEIDRPLPDGTTGYRRKLDLYVLRLGREPRRITRSQVREIQHQPSWSPDGRWIAFSHGCVPCDGADIEAIRPDGSGRRDVMRQKDNSQNEEPSWSHDGITIVFNDITITAPLQLASFCCSDGYLATSLVDAYTYRATRDVRNPEWSPVGHRVLFAGVGRGSFDLFTLSVDGDELRRVDRHPSDSFPGSWDPTGRKVVFFSDRGGPFDIYVMGADGSSVERLTGDGSNNIDPDWI